MDEMREALERIVALDYRGHPSMEQTIARAALDMASPPGFLRLRTALEPTP